MNSPDEIYQRILQVMEELFDIEPQQVSRESRLYEDLDIDSIDAVDLMAWMVKLTGKRMNPEDFRNVRTVGDVINQLEKQLT